MVGLFRFIFSKVFVLNLIIALLLLSGGLYATLSYLDSYTLHGMSKEVPNLLDKSVEELDTLLDKGDFTYVISDSVYVNEKAGGIVLEQDPRPNYKVKQGRKIYISVTAFNPPQIELPELVDLSLRQASSLMETYGIKLGELSYKPDRCKNCILEVLHDGKPIEAGTKIEKGIELNLVVGQGLSNELTDVPYLIDFKIDMAKELLKAKFLNLGSLIYDETIQNGEDSLNARVYKYSPFYSEEPTVPMGSSVDLFLTVDTNRIDHTVHFQDSI